MENIEALEKRLWSSADNLRANSPNASILCGRFLHKMKKLHLPIDNEVKISYIVADIVKQKIR